MILGSESALHWFVLQVIYLCCRRLLQIAARWHAGVPRCDNIDIIKKTASHAFNNSSHDKDRPTLHSVRSTPGIGGLSSSLSRGTSRSLESFTAVDYSKCNSHSPSLSHSPSSQSMSEADSDSDSRLGPIAFQGSQSDLRKKLRNMDIRNSQEFHVEVPVARVVEAMAQTEYSEGVQNRVHQYKVHDVRWMAMLEDPR